MAVHMKNITPFPRRARTHSPDVVVLDCTLQLHFDPEPLRRLFAHKELHVAEEAVCRLLEDIALRLDALQRGLAVSAFGEMQQPAKRIAMMARELGLIEVANAADHVGTCLAQADGVAIESVIARLERGFDLAVSEIWSLRDL